jgi:hypothetical protein
VPCEQLTLTVAAAFAAKIVVPKSRSPTAIRQRLIDAACAETGLAAAQGRCEGRARRAPAHPRVQALLVASRIVELHAVEELLWCRKP